MLTFYYLFFVFKNKKLTKTIGKHNAKFTKDNANAYITPTNVVNSINTLSIIFKNFFICIPFK